MSPCPDKNARGSRADGFTLIEVIVAMTIFMVVAAAAAPVLVGSLRGAAVARDITQSKGVAQGRIEQMRDLPFYVGQAAGDYKDVLDSYYRCGPTASSPGCSSNTPSVAPTCASTTLTALPPTGWTGYVASTAAHCVWEPTGPLYRTVVNPVAAPGLGVFSMVISTQFLTGGDSPVAVAPSSTYTTQKPVRDAPPSSQIGVTVAVFYKCPSGVHYTSTYSQIEQGTAITPLITSEAKATTVRVASALNADTNLLEQLGVINLSGELFTGSRVVTTASAATAGDSLGQQISGAQVNLVAPLDQTATSASVNGVKFPVSNCDYQCFGKTQVDQASALSSNGLPKAGTPTLPVRAMIPDGAGDDGFRFSNGTADARLKLEASKPMVSLDLSCVEVMNTGCHNHGSMAAPVNCVVQPPAFNGPYLIGTGYLDATATTVGACGTAQSNTIRLFPTQFAHDGVIRITLESATASCSVTKPGGGSAGAAYRATVSYWNGSGYTSVALASTSGTDLLAGVDLNQSVAAGLKLGDYVRAWKSTTASEVRTSTSATSAQAAIPSAVSITTQPTRGADDASVVSLDLGAVSCQVGDRR